MIHVFDALGTFTADTSQLDQFTIKLEHGLTGASQKAASATIALKAAQEEFRASITAVNAEGGKTTENMLRLADAEQQLALAAAAARQEHAALKSSLTDAGVAAEKTAVSMHEARGEAMLLGEAFGIHLPRHVTSFLASIPGISEALSAAFSATAVLFLIDAVVKGAEKLSDWVAETFIFTDAMKKETATIAETNKAILAQIDLYKRAEEAIREFGLTGSTLTKSKMDELTEAIDKNKDALRNAENQLYGLRNGFVDVVGDAGQFENKVNQLTSAIKTQNEQMDLLQRQHDQEQTDEIIRAENERISAAKTASSARISVSESEALLKLAITGGNYSQLLAIQNKAEEQQLHNDVSAMAQRIAALAFEGDRTKGERQKLSADIEKLIDDHNNKVRAIYAKAYEDIRQIGKTPIPFITEVPPGMETIQNAITQGFDQAKAAAEALGITLKTDLDDALSAAFQAYDKLLQLQKSGVVTQRDVDNGYKALIKSELAYAIATGASGEAVKKLQEQLKQIIQAEIVDARAKGASIEVIKKLEKELKGATASQQGFLASLKSGSGLEQVWERDLASGKKGMVDFGETAKFVSDEFGAAWESAFQQWILGEASLGQAMAKGTAEVMAQLAARALVYGLFYTAQGIADVFWDPPRAGADFTAAAEFFAIGGAFAGGAAAVNLGAGGGGGSSASSGGGGTPGPASNSPNLNSQQPSQVVNVTHMTDTIQSMARVSPNLSIPSSLVFPQSAGSSSTGPVSGIISKQDIQELTKAIKQNPGMSHVSVTIEGDLPMLVTKINHGTKTGRLRLHSTSTSKTIKQA